MPLNINMITKRVHLRHKKSPIDGLGDLKHIFFMKNGNYDIIVRYKSRGHNKRKNENFKIFIKTLLKRYHNGSDNKKNFSSYSTNCGRISY